jgi:hypothetical protein
MMGMDELIKAGILAIRSVSFSRYNVSAIQSRSMFEMGGALGGHQHMLVLPPASRTIGTVHGQSSGAAFTLQSMQIY